MALFFYFLRLCGNNVFIPKENPDVSHIPPFSAVLEHFDNLKEKSEEQRAIKDIVTKIVKSEEDKLEDVAEEILEDEDKLNKFFSLAKSFGVIKENQQNASNFLLNVDRMEMSEELEDLLKEQYRVEFLTNKKVSLNIKRASIKDIIALFSKTTSLNFILEPGIESIVESIYLQDYPANKALYYCLRHATPSLALKREGDVLKIGLEKDIVRELKTQLFFREYKSWISSFYLFKNVKLTEDLRERIKKIWNGIFLKKEESEIGYLVFDLISGTVYFRAKKYICDEFKKILQAIDKMIPQVEIEARVVLASKEFENTFGFNWFGFYNRRSSLGNGWYWHGFANVNQASGGEVSDSNLSQWALNFLPSSWLGKGSLNLPFLFGSKLLDSRRLNLGLILAEARKEAKTVLKPSILVNSGETAEILVGKEVPIKTIITDHSDAQFRNLTTINYKELGIKLRVKPIVLREKDLVFLDIFVEDSHVDGTSFDYATSQIITTRSHNRVLLKNGQTTMIGGLINSAKTKEGRGIPFLHRIPILGFLFGAKQTVSEDSQFLIFITPKIVDIS